MHYTKSIFLFIFFIYSISNTGAENTKPLVVATASMIADIADNIGGEFIELKTIVPIGGDPHMYEPTPSDAVLASKADVVLLNGLTFEGWLNELIDNSGTKADMVLVTEGIVPITSTVYKNAPDPHAWMDAENGIVYAKNIKDALTRILPSRAKEFAFNFNAYKSTLISLHEYIKKEINKIPKERRVLITSHDAFQYYGRKYGLTLESVLGTSTDAQAQTSDIVRLNKIIKSSGVPAVFIESTVNPKLLNQIAEDNNVKIGGKLFSDSIGEKDSDAPTYVDMLKFNTETIVNALLMSPAENSIKKQQSSRYLWILPAVLVLALIVVFFLKRNSQ